MKTRDTANTAESGGLQRGACASRTTSPGTSLDCICVASTSLQSTPPQVTNSSLFESLPEKGSGVAVSREDSASTSARRSSPHRLAPVASASSPPPHATASHSLPGSPNGLALRTSFRRPSTVNASSAPTTPAPLSAGSRLSLSAPAYPASASSTAANALSLSAAGPLTPRCVTSKGPREESDGEGPPPLPVRLRPPRPRPLPLPPPLPPPPPPPPLPPPPPPPPLSDAFSSRDSSTSGTETPAEQRPRRRATL